MEKEEKRKEKRKAAAGFYLIPLPRTLQTQMETPEEQDWLPSSLRLSKAAWATFLSSAPLRV